MLNGITGITARINDIEHRISSMTQQTAAKTASAVSNTSQAFASALASAVHGSTAASTTSATTGTTGSTASMKVNSAGIPEDLAAFGNGKIPANALGHVGNTNHKLWAPAAEKLTQMIADAKAQGVNIGITDSYRPYEEQVDLARRKGLYSQGGLAAKPGTSDHGWGMATDLDLNAKAQTWMRQNAAKYGFEEDTPREPWHWGFKPEKLQ
ncbi:LAS superfamily LD-carboxypeptidase LdcB [Catenuloplanes nepalensis]|uniref:LAS superfamily LD-carboxypeptidase LdcB n=1 Tax=Catenuloplanes nepalensis TaxID=587533 RepID=A0ABT9MV45_9ACTN|nr:M15 family metallopeptidase [Catenuloplanes nepalensis]MDP9795298.1 LAS superfamily LD-carboxypeptidase LdcB [Catenuloplanes nepalensis]